VEFNNATWNWAKLITSKLWTMKNQLALSALSHQQFTTLQPEILSIPQSNPKKFCKVMMATHWITHYKYVPTIQGFFRLHISSLESSHMSGCSFWHTHNHTVPTMQNFFPPTRIAIKSVVTIMKKTKQNSSLANNKTMLK